MTKEQVSNLLISVAMLMLLTAAFLPLLKIYWEYLDIVYAAGAVLAVIGRLVQRFDDRSKRHSMGMRVRRLRHIEFWSAMCYLVSAFFMFYDPVHSNWLGFLTAGAALQIYTSFMIPYAQKKDAAKETAKTGKKE